MVMISSLPLCTRASSPDSCLCYSGTASNRGNKADHLHISEKNNTRHILHCPERWTELINGASKPAASLKGSKSSQLKRKETSSTVHSLMSTLGLCLHLVCIALEARFKICGTDELDKTIHLNFHLIS